MQLGAAVGWPGVLQGCTSLTYLNLRCSIIDAPYGALVGSLSSLVHLQHLELMPGRDVAGLSPSTLPRLQHLTYLKVKCLSDANLYQLGALTSLQELHLWFWDDPADSHLAASSLAGLVLPASLKKLSLESEVGAELLSVAPAGLQHLMVNSGVYGPAEEPESFLSCIGRLQRLTALSLNPGRYFAWLPAGPAYSALTASSDLVRLEMTGYGFSSGLWSHVFVTTRKLPQLTSLSLTVFTKPNWGGKEPIEFCAGDLSRLTSSCPSLSHIGTLCLQPRLYVSELHKLSALTSLRVYFESVGPDSFGESMRGLAAVTQLQKLRLIKSAGLTVASLLPLTSLTTLTRLQLEKGFDNGARISLAYTSNAQVSWSGRCIRGIAVVILHPCILNQPSGRLHHVAWCTAFTLGISGQGSAPPAT